MAKRLLKNNLIKSEDISEQLKLINGSQTCYVTPAGNIYVDYGNGLFLKRNYHLTKSMVIFTVVLSIMVR
jgi:hypothetical protein